MNNYCFCMFDIWNFFHHYRSTLPAETVKQGSSRKWSAVVSCDQAIALMKEGAAKAFRVIGASSMMTTMGEMKGMVYQCRNKKNQNVCIWKKI